MPQITCEISHSLARSQSGTLPVEQLAGGKVVKDQVRLSVRQTGTIQRKALILTTLGLIPVTTLGISFYNSTVTSSDDQTQSVQENATPAAEYPTSTESQSESWQAETGSNSQSVSVQVNGQAIEVPPSGNVNTSIPTDNGSVDVDIKSDGAPDDSSSSVDVHIQTNSSNEGGNDAGMEARTRTRIRIKER